jgi:hypothetical protein
MKKWPALLWCSSVYSYHTICPQEIALAETQGNGSDIDVHLNVQALTRQHHVSRYSKRSAASAIVNLDTQLSTF